MSCCFICPSPCLETCPRCERVQYCLEHSQYHRDTEQCFPYTVSHAEGVGRLLLASRDIHPGDVIFREEALVTGPGKTTRPVCLGCLDLVDCSVRCDGCHWPLCSSQCANIDNHTREECQLIEEMGDSIILEEQQGEEEVIPLATIQTLYRSIKILRALLLPPSQLHFLMQFMGHQSHQTGPGERPVTSLVCQWGKGRWTMEQVTN